MLLFILAGTSMVLGMVTAKSFKPGLLNPLTPINPHIPYQDIPYCIDTEFAEAIYGEKHLVSPTVPTSTSLEGCKLKLESFEVLPDEVDELDLPVSPIRISGKNEIVIQIPPCITPTPPSDYGGLLPPGTMICGGFACIQGHEIVGRPTPTRFPGQPDFLEISDAVIIYESNGECIQDTISP